MSDDLSGLSGREAALAYLCARRFSLQLLFYGSILGLIVNTISVGAVGVNSPAGVVIVLNYFGLVALGLFSGGVLWKCRGVEP